MLDWVIRYEPICGLLDTWAPRELLEVGSGSHGVTEYYGRRIPIFGLDLAFSGPTLPRLTPIRGSGLQLPFRDSAFDAVLCVDVLEHVSPPLRGHLIREIKRVTRRVAILACPVGRGARLADVLLSKVLMARGRSLPGWLEEHLMCEVPEEGDLEEHLNANGFTWRKIPNANRWFQLFVCIVQGMPGWARIQPWLEPLVRRGLRSFLRARAWGKPYRMIYVARPHHEAEAPLG